LVLSILALPPGDGLPFTIEQAVVRQLFGTGVIVLNNADL
jgi:hypothetical protein